MLEPHPSGSNNGRPRWIIVQFKDGLTEDQMTRHLIKVNELHRSQVGLGGTSGVGLKGQMRSALQGYAGQYHPNVIKEIANMSDVARWEYGKKIISDTWGYDKLADQDTYLAKISIPNTEFQRQLNETGDMEYKYPKGSGADCVVFVLENGFVNIEDASGKPAVKNVTINPNHWQGNGTWDNHGTQITNIVASERFGVARDTEVHLVWRGTSTAGLLLAINEIVAEAESLRLQRPLLPIVVNCSFTITDQDEIDEDPPGSEDSDDDDNGEEEEDDGDDGGDDGDEDNKPVVSEITDQVFDKLTAKGITIVASAGNQGEWVDIYKRWPRAYLQSIVVGGVNMQDKRVKSSSWGSRVDIWAPGKEMPMLTREGKLSEKFGRGTSYAAAVVSGTLACLLPHVVKEKGRLPTPDEVRDLLRSYARKSLEPLYGDAIRGDSHGPVLFNSADVVGTPESWGYKPPN